MIKLDEIDRDIIRQLQKDSRISVRRISKIINISEKKIRIRINKLMNQKIIKPICIVNPTAFGYVNFVDIFLKLIRTLILKSYKNGYIIKGMFHIYPAIDTTKILQFNADFNQEKN